MDPLQLQPLSNSDVGDTSADELDEPKLSYERILNDLADVLRADSITSACLHDKFLAIGTLGGRIYVFDHLGNRVRQEICVHPKPVNSIDIDAQGEHIVSCSSNMLVVFGLCNREHDSVLMPDKAINVVAIDPNFSRSGGGKRFVAGDTRVVLYERGFLARYKPTVLQSKEQKVRAISWHGQFIAWATDLAVQIFDVEQRAIITRIKRDSDYDSINEHDPCQFCWKNNKTLLIGWSNSVKICVIKERSYEVINDSQLRELPRKYVEIISMFETEFTISGLAPFNENLFTLSLDNPCRQPRSMSYDTQSSCNSSQISGGGHSSATTSEATTAPKCDNSSIQSKDNLIRPQVHIMETLPNSYNELSKDILTPNQCLTCGELQRKTNVDSVTKNFPYFLLSLHNEGIYFIICAKDVISAKPRDCDDHIDWLMQHSMFEECHRYAKENSHELSRHSVKGVTELYMKELLDKNTPESYSEAAKLCASICGSDLKSWDDVIEKFCDLNQLRHLLPYLPRNVDGFHLETKTYDFMMNEFLRYDPVSLFKAVKEIPCELYSLQTITEQVIISLANDPKNLVLNEALAELYTRMEKFEDAVNIYLDYNDKTRIFSLIRGNNLVSILRDKVDRLMQIDADETAVLLVENRETIPMKEMIGRLGKLKSERYLTLYLHRLVLKDPDCCIEYHNLMVKLYANHQRVSLLNFLKTSTNYSLEEALQICKESNLIKEVVFLHVRMGDLRIALKYIIEFQGDIKEAIEFCKEHQDRELWKDLIICSMDKPEFIGSLLKNIGTEINDPIELIDRIPVGCEIEGLIPALVKILQDYQLQISLEQSCRDLMARDCFSLLERQIRCQTQGIAIKEDQLCDHCNQALLNESAVGHDSRRSEQVVGRDATGSSSEVAGTSGGAGTRSGLAGPGSAGGAGGQSAMLACSSANDLVVFGCHHVFHEECCADAVSQSASNQASNGDADTKLLSCRVCMLEKDYDNAMSS